MSDPADAPPLMEHLVSLHYSEPLSPYLERFADGLLAGRIVGHRCPSCRRVYVPGRGYCPLCVVPTGDSDEVEVSDNGIVSGFTIVTPVQYYGQQKTEPFVSAQVLLDGADTILHSQAIVGIPNDEVRSGMRVRAVWRPEAQRDVSALSNRGGGSVGGVIDGFEPTGEPDLPPERYQEFVL